MMNAKMTLTHRIQLPLTIVHLRHLHLCRIHKYWLKFSCLKVFEVTPAVPQLILYPAQ